MCQRIPNESFSFSSTTSLKITKEVKEQEKDKDRGPAILQESIEYRTTQNIYGLTEKAADKIWIQDGNTNITIYAAADFSLKMYMMVELTQPQEVFKRQMEM